MSAPDQPALPSYRSTTDELSARLEALKPPRDATEQILFIEAMSNIEYAGKARRKLRNRFEHDPLASGSDLYEALANYDGIADGVLFALETLRGMR